MNELPKKQIMVSFHHSYFFFFFVSSFWLVFFLNPRPLCHLLILSVSRSFNGNSKTTKENAMQIFQNVLQSLNAIAQVSSSTNLKKIVYWTLCKNNFIHILFIIPSSTNEKKGASKNLGSKCVILATPAAFLVTWSMSWNRWTPRALVRITAPLGATLPCPSLHTLSAAYRGIKLQFLTVTCDWSCQFDK